MILQVTFENTNGDEQCSVLEISGVSYRAQSNGLWEVFAVKNDSSRRTFKNVVGFNVMANDLRLIENHWLKVEKRETQEPTKAYRLGQRF